MAVCNIFDKLTKPTGTFLTFAQYMDDLTKWQTESSYHKIVPSKFIALDIDPGNYNNTSLPRLFQVRYENACARFKNPSTNSSEDLCPETWSAEYSKTLFWDMMFESGLITKNSLKEIKYVGDINIQSYNEVDGMGYSELYCHIPNEASAGQYSYTTKKIDPGYSSKPGDALEGFTLDDMNGSAKLAEDEKQDYIIDKLYTFDWTSTITTAGPFNINAIIILYNILDNDNISISDIPMGIYLTGKIGLVSGETNKYEITNSITKYISHPDIYDSGTSYGLRICSKYVTGSQNVYINPIISAESDNTGDLSRVLTQLSISQNKMDTVIKGIYEKDHKYKELYDLFTNSKTNVPYIKTINGVDYWFVNGKMIQSVSLTNTTNDSNSNSSCSSYSEEELDAKFNSYNLNLYTSLQLSYKDPINDSILTTHKYSRKYIIVDRTSDDAIENKALTAFINWKALYNGSDVTEKDDLKIGIFKIEDGEEKLQPIQDKNGEFHFQIQDDKQYLSHTYRIKAEYNGDTDIDTVRLKYVYPTYFGHSSYIFNSQNIDNIISDLQSKIIIGTKKQSHLVQKSDDEDKLRHLYLIYPAEFGELVSIRDEQNHSYLSDFKKYDITISFNDTNHKDVQYFLYTDEKGAVSVDNKIIYFQ